MQWLVYIFRRKKTESELDGRGQSGVLLHTERIERVVDWLGHKSWKRELMSEEQSEHRSETFEDLMVVVEVFVKQEL